MPIVRFQIDASNSVDDRLRGYSIDVRTMPGSEIDADALLIWVQNIALGVIDEGWTESKLSEDAVDIRIVDSQTNRIVDTL